MSAMVFTLCKQLDDEPKPEVPWIEVQCVLCERKLRLTLRAVDAQKKHGITVQPVCFECAKLGPDEVMRLLDL